MTDLLTVINHPLFNAISIFIIKYFTKDISSDDPSALSYIRQGYLISQAINLGLHYLLIYIIRKKNDQTSLKYVEPGRTSWNGTKTADQLINTTFTEYDVLDTKQSIKQCFTSIAMVVFIHLQFHFLLPLIIQPIMSFKTFLTSKQAQIHLWGRNTNHGDLKRPFRLMSPFGTALPENQQPRVDRGSIKKVEKSKNN